MWPEHRPYAVAAARAALAAEGIPVHARGEELRRLLQFFGPYVPIELMVPRADVERATTILTEVLLARPEEARSSAARAPGPRSATGIAAALRGRRGAALALLGAGLAALAIVPRSTRPVHPVRPDALQLLTFADDVDFDYTTAPLPRGASLRPEIELSLLGFADLTLRALSQQRLHPSLTPRRDAAAGERHEIGLAHPAQRLERGLPGRVAAFPGRLRWRGTASALCPHERLAVIPSDDIVGHASGGSLLQDWSYRGHPGIQG